MIDTIKQMASELEAFTNSMKARIDKLQDLIERQKMIVDKDGYISWTKGDGTPPFPKGTRINHRNDWPKEDREVYDLHYFDWHSENPGHKGYRVVSIPYEKMRDFRGRGRRMPDELNGNEFIYFYPKTVPGFSYEVSKKLHGPVRAKDMVWWNDTQQIVYWYAVPTL